MLNASFNGLLNHTKPKQICTLGLVGVFSKGFFFSFFLFGVLAKSAVCWNHAGKAQCGAPVPFEKCCFSVLTEDIYAQRTTINLKKKERHVCLR